MSSEMTKWLAELGLEKYAGVFETAEVDLATIPHLTEDDLKVMSLPVGPRRKVLAAKATPIEPARTVESAETSPERRHLTVIFIYLVGSAICRGRR